MSFTPAVLLLVVDLHLHEVEKYLCRQWSLSELGFGLLDVFSTVLSGCLDQKYSSLHDFLVSRVTLNQSHVCLRDSLFNIWVTVIFSRV